MAQLKSIHKLNSNVELNNIVTAILLTEAIPDSCRNHFCPVCGFKPSILKWNVVAWFAHMKKHFGFIDTENKEREVLVECINYLKGETDAEALQGYIAFSSM